MASAINRSPHSNDKPEMLVVNQFVQADMTALFVLFPRPVAPPFAKRQNKMGGIEIDPASEMFARPMH